MNLLMNELASRPGRSFTDRTPGQVPICSTRFADSGLILTARPHTGREYYYGEHSTIDTVHSVDMKRR